MYPRAAATALTATVLVLTAPAVSAAADDLGPGLGVSVLENDSDSTGDGPLQPGAPVVVSSDVDLTSIAGGETGKFTVDSPAFTEPVTVKMEKNGTGQGEGAIRCGIKPGRYRVAIAGRHESAQPSGGRAHVTVTVAGGGSYCDQAAGWSAKNTATAAAAGGVALLAVGGFAVIRRRRGRT